MKPWLSSLPVLMQNRSGGDSVVLGIVSLFPTPPGEPVWLSGKALGW